MTKQEHFTSVQFHRYKAFRDYSVSLHRFNVLVGPNNSGKSTILSAFRILAEGMRKARSRKPSIVPGPHGEEWGYSVDLANVAVATENVFFDYDDSQPASVRFRVSNGNQLVLFFPPEGGCCMVCETKEQAVVSSATFKSQYNLSVGFVPILGPVEHDEPLYQREAARLALLTHRAARNFRNIWYHYPDGFADFRALVCSTWPGMDIEPPEIDTSHDKTLLRMFCPEDRIPREIFWAGFGFQVWCQMLTYIVRSKASSLFIIDEPDIYLHADVQRQLLGILKALGPDILIATHSTEIITETDPDDLLLINKKHRSGRRVKDPSQLQRVFRALGSNLNPILTQLAKTRRALFVEGADFQILSRFARRLGHAQVANRSDFAVIPLEGFKPEKVRDYIQGIETTLGTKVVAGAIFDRDYRSDLECKSVLAMLKKHCMLAHIHERKELENYLLHPEPLGRAIERRVTEQNRRTDSKLSFQEDVSKLLAGLADSIRQKVESRYLAKRARFEKTRAGGVDNTTIIQRLIAEFEERWEDEAQRWLIVPGKEMLTLLNSHLQDFYGITISTTVAIDSFRRGEVPSEMASLIEGIEEFRTASPA